MELEITVILCVCVCEVTQSCPTLCDPMDTRFLHPWDFLGKSTGVGCLFLLQGTSRSRDQTQVSCIVDRHFTILATREEISSLSYPIVFLYFFALITEEGFLISPCYSLELCIQMGISFLFSFAFCIFSQLFVRPPQTATLPFCISFSWGWS